MLRLLVIIYRFNGAFGRVRLGITVAKGNSGRSRCYHYSGFWGRCEHTTMFRLMAHTL